MAQQLELLDLVQAQINQFEVRIRQTIQLTPSVQLVMSSPGIGDFLSIVIDREVGCIARFPSACHFASYAGTVPKLNASGGKFHYGRMVKQANHYLKWAFIEAANVVVRHRNHPLWKSKFVCQLYERTRRRKGHAVAVGAVARHLAEATFWVLKKGQPYKEPGPRKPSPKQGRARG